MGGGGSFPTPPGVLSISSPPIGGWTEVGTPHAAYDPVSNTTFIAYAAGNTRADNIEVVAYDHDTDTLGAYFVLGTLSSIHGSPDSHAGPAILIRDDGRIMVFFCTQGSTFMELRISTNPRDVSAFDSTISFDPGGANFLYPMACQLDTGRIFLHWKDFPSNTILGRSFSDDGGLTWSARSQLWASTNGYYAFASDGVRMDYAVTDIYPGDGPTDMYHFYTEGSDDFESDGTMLSGTGPYAAGDLTNIVTNGDVFPYSITYTSDGRPTIACQSRRADPVELFEHRWSGSAWARHDILTSDPISPSVLSVGGLTHDWDDANRVVTGKVVSGSQQIWQYLSPDDGVTWYGSALTTTSDRPNSPVQVIPRGPDLGFLWFVGDFTDSFDYEVGLEGYR